ncbi:MAG: class I SAM-dependent methyltransferase [Candidatus Poribacteria bacterium]|jgi:methylase of polypeptide subunit release factors|nr:class I SAM-dependent methyltransferase [Candidatus Poribacteria bacterium]
MQSIYRVRPIGDIYVPVAIRSTVSDGASIKFFDSSDLSQPNRIFNHLKRDGLALVSGRVEQIQQLTDYLQRKRRELSDVGNRQQKRGRALDKRSSKSERVTAVDPLQRVMVLADATGKLQLDPVPDLPFLIELIGESAAANGEYPFMLPLAKLDRIQTALSNAFQPEGFSIPIVASDNVLPPQSQETATLFRQGLENLPLPSGLLDLGCGSGLLSIMAARLFPQAQIIATDIMPEATATTKINLQKQELQNRVEVCQGDLFQNLKGQTFDVIIFNAPWVVARVRSRAEIPTNDEKQQTITCFFEQVDRHLAPQGHLLLGYADHSGEKAINQLTDLINQAGYKIGQLYNARVVTHRSKKRRENIMVYDLVRSDDNE